MSTDTYISDLIDKVSQESADCIARVQSLINQARLSGLRMDGVFAEYACNVLDAADEVKAAMRKGAERQQEERDEELAPQYAAQARRDYIAYRG